MKAFGQTCYEYKKQQKSGMLTLDLLNKLPKIIPQMPLRKAKTKNTLSILKQKPSNTWFSKPPEANQAVFPLRALHPLHLSPAVHRATQLWLKGWGPPKTSSGAVVR